MLLWLLVPLAGAAPPLPTFPKDFHAHSEIASARGILRLREFFDFTGNRLRFDIEGADDPPETDFVYAGSDSIYTYTDGSCKIEILKFNDTVFSNSGKQLLTSNSFFQFDPTIIKYIGNDTVRGQIVDVWRENRSMFGINMTITFYLLNDVQKNSAQLGYAIPVRLVQNITYDTGFDINQRDYFDFRIGRPHEWHFQRIYVSEDYNAICPTWKFPSLHKTIPTLPDSFSSRIEANIVEKNYSLEVRDVYDGVNSRILREVHTSNGGLLTTQTIYDSVQGHIVETIYSQFGSSCNVQSSITQSSGGPLFFNVTNGHLFHTATIFGETGRNFSYEGEVSARGVTCDLFLAEVVNSNSSNPAGRNITYQLSYYFSSTPPWLFARRPSPGLIGLPQQGTVPVRIRIKGVDSSTGPFEHFYEFIDFVFQPDLTNEFAVPVGCGTVDPTPAVNETLSCDSETESVDPTVPVAVAVIVTLLAGVPLGACAGYNYNKRKSRGRTVSDVKMDSVARPQNEDSVIGERKGSTVDPVGELPGGDFREEEI